MARLGAACGALAVWPGDAVVGSERYRVIRTARLRPLPILYLRPIDVMVYHGPRGGLVLRGASRLDAFSGYPVRTWLPSCATGVTTGAPEVRPSRSSRTRDRSSQVSYTHGR